MCRLSAVSTSLPATLILDGRAVSCTLLLVPKYATDDLLGFRSNPFNQNQCCRLCTASLATFHRCSVCLQLGLVVIVIGGKQIDDDDDNEIRVSWYRCAVSSSRGPCESTRSHE